MRCTADLDVGCPAVVIRLPLHPPLKDLPGSWDVVQHLLHVDVLVPQLVNTWQQGDGPIPNIACMIDEARTHLHLSILEPQGDTGIADIQGTLPDRACPPIVFLRLLPLSILQHGAHERDDNRDDNMNKCGDDASI